MHAVGLAKGDFEEWLLGEYLPQLHQNKALPQNEHVHEKALRYWCGHGPEEDGPKRVLDLLYKLDRTLEIAIEVVRFGFFDSQIGAQKGRLDSSHGRALTHRFEQKKAHNVTWQVELRHEELRENPVLLAVDWKMTLEDGSRFAQNIGSGTERLNIAPNWTTSWLAKGWGWAEAGNWKKGRHKALLTLWRHTLASGEFEIA